VIDTAGILDLRDGRVVRMQGYMNPADALEAAGLEEEAMSPPTPTSRPPRAEPLHRLKRV
jgi:hypothetical protein